MFNWICPQCGREVSPSYNECPDCAAKTQAAPPGPTQAAPPPPMQPPQYAPAPPPQQAPTPPPPGQQYPQPAYQQQPPQQYYQQPQAGYPPPPPGYYAAPPPPRRMSTWLVTLLVAATLTAAGAAAYYFLPSTRAQRGAADQDTEPAKPLTKGEAAAAARLAKNIEISGLRIVEEKKKPILKFLVVNHSSTEIADLEGSLTLHASNAPAGSDPISIVKLKVASIGANESQEVSSPIKTALRAYELPDWQFLRADLTVTSH